MNDEEKRQQFKQAIKYKHIGFLIILLAAIPIIMLDGIMKYLIAVIIFGIGVYFERLYRCPFCRKVFDPRFQPIDLTYCPRCSKKLQ